MVHRHCERSEAIQRERNGRDKSPVCATDVAHWIASPSARNDASSAAFTLMELSVSLIVIGMIVGSVILASEIKEGAAIRADIAQMDEFNKAAENFRLKYNYLPGDMPDAIANANFTTQFNPGANGNGKIDPSSDVTVTQEPYAFFDRLNAAGFSAFRSSGYGGGVTVYNKPGGLFPRCKVQDNCGIIPFTASRFGVWTDYSGGGGIAVPMLGEGSWWHVGMGANPANSALGWGTFSNDSFGLTPQISKEFDRKLDDGMPNSGNVRVSCMNYWSGELDTGCEANGSRVSTGNQTCLSTDVPRQYDPSEKRPACRIVIRATW